MKINIEQTRKSTYTAKVFYYEEALNKEVSMYLCSKVDPVREGDNWAKSVYRSDIQEYLVYGIGMGYHIQALCRRLTSSQKLYVLESNIELNEELKEYNYQNLEHEQCEVWVTDKLKDIEQLFRKMGSSSELLIYLPCVKVIPKHLSWLKHRLQQVNVQRNNDAFVELIEENYKYNNIMDCKNVSRWYGTQKEKSIIIVSGGPSLDKNIEWLKGVNEKVFIFSTGRTLKRLVNEGIRVDMFCIIDSQKDYTYKQIEGVENLDIPFIFLNTASHYTVSHYNGPKYRAYSMDSTQAQEGRIESGGSVATAMLDLAIKFGSKTIIFVGQDLAYTDNKSHCSNSISIETIEQETSRHMKQVRGINGEYLPTTEALLSYKYWIEQKIRRTTGISFINATEGGALIEGCQHMKLQDILMQMKAIKQ